jgi:UDP-N-acetylmuramoyl-tripeptide--D-alanyl-D-alanine ligase
MGEAALWTAADAAAATGGRATSSWRAGGVAIDSRAVEPGDLFVALRGPKNDGHDYVAGALAAGAAAVLVDHVPAGFESAPLLVVADTFDGLNALARAARHRCRARIVAVTGSVGKTSVKEALKLVLSRQAKTAATVGNLNNQWGVPLSLARMAPDTAYGVFEMGMNHPGELTPLSQLVQPDVAVITTIAPAHTEFFAAIGEIADAKAEIFNGMRGGTAVLNRDNAYFATLAVAAFGRGLDRIVGFGAHPDATARVESWTPSAEGSAVNASINGRRLAYRIAQPGRHWVINSLAVLAAAAALGADLAAAAAALAELPAAKGRGERHHVAYSGGAFLLIDDSYNASPASMRAAFEILGISEPGRGGRRIAVLGDMLELGPTADELHAGLADALLASGVELVFTAGAHMKHLHEALPRDRRGGHAATSEGLAPLVLGAVRPGDVVTVKGSFGSRMAVIVGALKSIDNTPPRAANGY